MVLLAVQEHVQFGGDRAESGGCSQPQVSGVPITRFSMLQVSWGKTWVRENVGGNGIFCWREKYWRDGPWIYRRLEVH